MQDDIRIAIVERSVAFLGPVHNGELLDPPDLETRTTSDIVPSVLCISRMFMNPFLDLGGAIRQEHRRKTSVSLTSEPKRAMFVSSMLYFSGFVRWAMLTSPGCQDT